MCSMHSLGGATSGQALKPQVACASVASTESLLLHHRAHAPATLVVGAHAVQLQPARGHLAQQRRRRRRAAAGSSGGCRRTGRVSFRLRRHDCAARELGLLCDGDLQARASTHRAKAATQLRRLRRRLLRVPGREDPTASAPDPSALAAAWGLATRPVHPCGTPSVEGARQPPAGFRFPAPAQDPRRTLVGPSGGVVVGVWRLRAAIRYRMNNGTTLNFPLCVT